MKKVMIILAMAMVLMLCACGSAQQPQQTTATETEAAAADPIIGTWLMTSYSLWMSLADDVITFEGQDLKDTFRDNYYKFDADGTGTITSPDQITQTNWKNTAPDTYLLTYINSKTEKEVEVMLTISGDTMTGLEGSKTESGAEYTLVKEK